MRFKRFFLVLMFCLCFAFFVLICCFFSFFACVFIFVVFFLLLFSNLGLDWVLLFFFRGFETSHWITVKKDFDKV